MVTTGIKEECTPELVTKLFYDVKIRSIQENEQSSK